MQEVTLITGASTGIGAAIADAEIAAGRTVLNLDQAPPKKTNERLIFVQADLSNREANASLLQSIGAQYAVSRIVNNVGATGGFAIEDIPLERLDLLYEFHMMLPVMIMQMALPGMRQRRFGRVLFTSSGAAKGRAKASIYSATKGAMMSYASSWALELGRDGITVNAVAPGPIQTEMFARGAPVGSANYEFQRRRAATGRIGLPEDVAALANFLLSDAASNITGQTIYTCGGASIGQAPLPPYEDQA